MIERHVERKDGIITPLWRGFRLWCPVCGQGRIFDGLLRMKATCPSCAVRFEREEGQFTGAVYINLIFTEIGFGLIFFYLAFFTKLDTWQQIAICIAWSVLFPLLFHRHAKGFFAGVVHLSRGLTADAPDQTPPSP